MDVFTEFSMEFRRGKTIENRELEPLYPYRELPGASRHRSRYVSSCIMSPFITRPVSFNNVAATRRAGPREKTVARVRSLTRSTEIKALTRFCEIFF